MTRHATQKRSNCYTFCPITMTRHGTQKRSNCYTFCLLNSMFCGFKVQRLQNASCGLHIAPGLSGSKFREMRCFIDECKFASGQRQMAMDDKGLGATSKRLSRILPAASDCAGVKKPNRVEQRRLGKVPCCAMDNTLLSGIEGLLRTSRHERAEQAIETQPKCKVIDKLATQKH